MEYRRLQLRPRRSGITKRRITQVTDSVELYDMAEHQMDRYHTGFEIRITSMKWPNIKCDRDRTGSN